MPIRKMACISRPLALADPVPLTLASLIAQSLIRTEVGVSADGDSAVSVTGLSNCDGI